MGKIFEALDDDLIAFIEAQPIFFVATAPLAADGLVNVSPKGLDTFRVLGPKTVAYLDLTGSGIETVAHAKENGRIVVMFCAFEGRPNILRLHGRVEALEPGHPDFDALLPRFPTHPGTRAILRVDVQRIADSCGFSVPRMTYERDRDQLTRLHESRSPERMRQTHTEKNAHSLDGLPGLALDGLAPE